MNWPTHSDYQEAIQNPQLCFQAPELKAGEVTPDALGLPRVISGNFACVYELTSGGKRQAIRCFVRQVPGQHGRYILLSKYLSSVRLDCLVRFEFTLQGILVHKEWYPIVQMEWVEGVPLNAWIERNVREPGRMVELADRFRSMMGALRQSRIAHGDLQHGNLMVTPAGDLRLVDYDGMYCPAFGRGHAPELGHPNFQHPRRTADFYEEGLDNFSALVIHASLLALAAEPDLLAQFYSVDNLLLSTADFKNPVQGPAFQRLKQSPDPRVQKLVALLQQCCVAPIEQVPWYEDTLVKLERGEPLTLGIPPSPVPAASRPAPLPASRPASRPVLASRSAPAVPTAPAAAASPGLPQWLVPALLGAVVLILAVIAYKLLFGGPVAAPSRGEEAGAEPAPPPPASAPAVPTPDAATTRPAGIGQIGALKGHLRSVNVLQLSPDGRWLASGSDDGTARVWDPQSGELRATLAGHVEGVKSLTWFSGQATLASVGGDYLGRVWDAGSGQLKKSLPDYQNLAWAPVFSPNGRTLAVGANNHRLVRLVDWVSGAVQTTLPEHKTWVRGADFSPDGGLLATYGFDDSVTVWNLPSAQAVRTLQIPTNGMEGVVFSLNRQYLAAAGEGGTVKVWNLQSGALKALAGHQGFVRSLAFAPSGRWLVSGGADRTIRLWEWPAGTLSQTFPAHSDAVTCLAVSADGKTLFSGGADSTVKLWDLSKL